MSFPIPVRYELTEELNNTRVVYNNGETLEMIPAENCINIGDMVVGGSVMWNQLVKNGNFSDGMTFWSVIGLRPVIVEDNTAIISIEDTASHFGLMQTSTQPILDGHIYLVVSDVKSSFDITHSGFGVRLGNAVTMSTIALNANTWVEYRAIVVASNIVNRNIQFFCSNLFISVGTLSFRNINIFDLTTMFGSEVAGYIYSLERSNAGAGVALFKKLFANNYYEYDAGSNKTIALIPQT